MRHILTSLTGHLLLLVDNTTTWCFIDLDWFNNKLYDLTKKSHGELLTVFDIENLLHEGRQSSDKKVMTTTFIKSFIKSFNIGFVVDDDKIQLAKLMDDNDANNGCPVGNLDNYKEMNRFFRLHVFEYNYVPFGFWVKLISTLLLYLERLIDFNNSLAYDMYQTALRTSTNSRNNDTLSSKARYWKSGFVFEDCDRGLFFSVIQDPNRQWLAEHPVLENYNIILCEVITPHTSQSAKILVMLVNHINTVLEDVYRMFSNSSVEYSPCIQCLRKKSDAPVCIFNKQRCFKRYQDNDYNADTRFQCESGHMIKLRRLYPEFVYDDCPDLILSSCHDVFVSFHENLGSGGSGIVKPGTLRCHGTNRLSDDADVKSLDIAVKFRKESNAELNAAEFLEFKKEAKMLLDASDHSNVVTMYGVALDIPFLRPKLSPTPLVEGSVKRHLALVMENGEGSLSRRISCDVHFGRVLLLRIAYQIADGLAYFHYLQIIHRDIKPGNILFLNDCIYKDINVKIADFDTACFENPENISQSVGTDVYKAPDYYQSLGYDYSVDVWAFGVVLFELLTLERPFCNTDSFYIKDRVLDGKTPLNGCTVKPRRDCHCLQMLMNKCWIFSAKERPKAKYLMYLLLNDCFQMLLFSYTCGGVGEVEEIGLFVKCNGNTKRLSVVVKRNNNHFVIKEINPTKVFHEWQDFDLTFSDATDQVKNITNIEYANIDSNKIFMLVQYGKGEVNYFTFLTATVEYDYSCDEWKHIPQLTAKAICELPEAHIVKKVQRNLNSLVVLYVHNKTHANCMRIYKWPFSGDNFSRANCYAEEVTNDITDFLLSTIVDWNNCSKENTDKICSSSLNNNRKEEDFFLFIAYTDSVKIYALSKISLVIKESLHIDLSEYTTSANSSTHTSKKKATIKNIYMHWSYLIVTFSEKSEFLVVPLTVGQKGYDVSQQNIPVKVRAFEYEDGNNEVTSFCSIFDTIWFGFDNGHIHVYTIKKHLTENATMEEMKGAGNVENGEADNGTKKEAEDRRSSKVHVKLLKNIKAYASSVESLQPFDYERPLHEPAAVVSYGKKLNHDAFYCNNTMPNPGGETIEFNRNFLQADNGSSDKTAANDLLLFWHAEESNGLERLSMERNVDIRRNKNLNFLESHCKLKPFKYNKKYCVRL